MLNWQQGDLGNLLDSKGEKRLAQKKARMKNLLKIAEPDEALYREIMLSLGYKNNKIQFLELAMILPYSEICKFKTEEKIEKALFYRAGFINMGDGLPKDFDFSLKMEKSVWNYKGIRPANFPEKRIKSISGLLFESCEKGLFKYFKQKIEENYTQVIEKSKAVRVVNKIISFQGAGKTRRLEIFFNIILPFFEVIFENGGKKENVKFLEDLYSNHPPLLDNSVTKSMKRELFKEQNESDVINSVKRYMGLIQLYNEAVKEEENDNT